MPARGRRIVLLLAAAALVLSAGRWGSVFLAERLWEASVSEAAALAGARRALLTLALELAGILTGVLWCLLNFTAAARVALPDRPPPEAERSRAWPARIPRWVLPVGAIVLGILAGAGMGAWRDEILLALDGARLGVRDPLLDIDLGEFLGRVPVRFHLQGAAFRLTLLGLAGVVGIHLAGGTIRLVDRKLWISPRARGHIAVLLALLALVLAWGRALEPYRLAAGDRGPLLPSAFLLNRSVSAVQAGFGFGAAVVTSLWWIRIRGVIAAAIWALFGIGLLAGRLVPLRTAQAVADPEWRAGARRLDSVSFGLGALDAPLPPAPPIAAVVPTLWDEEILNPALGLDSAVLSGARRSRLELPTRDPAPVWLAVRPGPSGAALLAVSDGDVSPVGRALSLRFADSLPAPGDVVFRDLPARTVRPAARSVLVEGEGPGVPLESWSRRLILAWALQSPGALRAPETARIGWRLDPVDRLRALAPFAHWEPARARLVGGEVVWESIGVLSAVAFPSSSRVPWHGRTVGMLRSSLVGLVWASSGVARIMRRSVSDSIAAAWARVASPLIEPPGALPIDLAESVGPSEAFAAARARALADSAWSVGRLGVPRVGAVPQPSPAAGGFTSMHPFLAPEACELRALLVTRGRAVADSVYLVRIDSTNTIECPLNLAQKWERFPFHHQLRDSVQATGAALRTGQVRYVITAEGIAAYQPAYAIPPGGGRATLLMVNVALGRRLGAGRTWPEAWRNLRGEVSPTAPGGSNQSILEAARRWMRHADSALRRGDLVELGRALQYLREILEQSPRRPDQ